MERMGLRITDAIIAKFEELGLLAVMREILAVIEAENSVRSAKAIEQAERRARYKAAGKAARIVDIDERGTRSGTRSDPRLLEEQIRDIKRGEERDALPLGSFAIRSRLNTPEVREAWSRHHPPERFDAELDYFVDHWLPGKARFRSLDGVVRYFIGPWLTDKRTVRRHMLPAQEPVPTSEPVDEAPELDREFLDAAKAEGLTDKRARELFVIFIDELDRPGKRPQTRVAWLVRWQTSWCRPEKDKTGTANISNAAAIRKLEQEIADEYGYCEDFGGLGPTIDADYAHA